MGSGISKTALLRHSDSRVDDIRAQIVASADHNRVVSFSRSAAGDDHNSTFTLRLTNSPEKSDQSPLLREASDGGKRSRAKSYPDLDQLQLWQSTKILAALHEGCDGNGDNSNGSSHSPLPSTPPSPHNSSHGLVHGNSMRIAPLEVLPATTDLTNCSSSDDYDYELDPFEQEITDWRKGETIGSGSYGTVYLARDEETGILMAVKEILVEDESDIDVSTATKEVELLRYLRHDHVVKYLGSAVDPENKKLSIFTEWVPGGNLEQNRKRFGGNEKIVRRFTLQILRGVAYLHSKNIIHHDIKPSNILVDQNGIVKLADFGSSRLISSSTCINNESMRGTPNYMAPEVIKQTVRSRKSDIWSVGCTVLRLLTGSPFWGDKKFDSQMALLYYIANLEALPPLPGALSDDARNFILSCLELDPVRRPSAEELLQHPFVKSVAVRSPPPPSSAWKAMRGIRTAPPERVAPMPSTEMAIPPTTAPSSSGSSDSTPRSFRGRLGSGFQSKANNKLAPLFPSQLDLPARPDDDENEKSIPSLSTTFVPISARGRAGVPVSTISEPTATGQYTYSDFSEPTIKTNKWEEQPILTDAARVERERVAAIAQEATRRREERERKFQEELAAFRSTQLMLRP